MAETRPRNVKVEGSTIADAATIFLNGKQYDGWKGFSISRRIDSLSGSFSLELQDRWRQTGEEWPIKPGDEVIIFIGKDKILEGFIDDLDASISAGDRSVSVSGRDRTGDLVDCVPKQQGELKNLSLVQLCQVICSPFSIQIQNLVSGIDEKFAVWTIKPEETAFETLERAARQRGVLLVSNDFGQLSIVRRGQLRASTELKEGENIITGNAKYSNADRFSEYKVIGQAPGDDNFSGDLVSAPSAKAFDRTIKRFRPTIIVAETNIDKAKAQDRANWENTVRAAKAFEVTISVPGFFQQDGRLWRVNERVKVTCGFLGLAKQDLLCTAVTFNKSDASGTVTSLELTRPDAFTPKAEITKDPKDDLGWEIQQARQAQLRKEENAE